MEKILLAINAHQMDRNTVKFACFIARITKSKLTGAFLENLLAEQETLAFAPHVSNKPAHATVSVETKESAILLHTETFKNACAEQGVACEVLYDKHMPSSVMIRESRFADLVIVNASASFEKERETTPTHFVKELLAGAECPVMIAPVNFEGIEEIIVAYDGSRSSMFALKQFTYLFPGLEEKRLILLQVNQQADMPIAEKQKISNMLKAHYSAIGFKVLEGRADEELFKYLSDRRKSLVVIGAFGRSVLSQLYRHSTAELLMNVVNLPVFIAHH